MARVDNLNNFLTDVAEAIRTKKGTTDTIPASSFDTEITNLPSGTDISGYFKDEIPTVWSGSINNVTRLIKKLPPFKVVPTGTSALEKTINYLFANYLGDEIDISQIDFTLFTSATNLFNNCHVKNIVGWENIDTSKITDFTSFFSNIGSGSYENFPMSDLFWTTCDFNVIDISSAKNLASMFQSHNTGRYGRTSLDISSWDASNVTNISGTFSSSGGYSEFYFMQNLGKGYSTSTSANAYAYRLDISYNNSLTEASLINVLNSLYDIATKGCNTQQVVMGSTNKNKLTSEEGQQALTNAQLKGWSVS